MEETIMVSANQSRVSLWSRPQAVIPGNLLWRGTSITIDRGHSALVCFDLSTLFTMIYFLFNFIFFSGQFRNYHGSLTVWMLVKSFLKSKTVIFRWFTLQELNQISTWREEWPHIYVRIAFWRSVWSMRVYTCGDEKRAQWLHSPAYDELHLYQ